MNKTQEYLQRMTRKAQCQIKSTDNHSTLFIDYYNRSCNMEQIDQYMYNGYPTCRQCLINVFEDCLPYSNDTRCKAIFYGIMSVQLLLIIIGLILNTIIVFVFCTRASLRVKIPNILFFHQAIADLFNGGVYGVGRVTYLLVKMVAKKKSKSLQRTFYAVFVINLLSSVFLCTIIAIHRFVSIYFPMWHRVHLTERHVHTSIIIIWFMTIPAVILYLVYDKIIIFWLMYFWVAPLVMFITILFISTFIKAFLSLRPQPTRPTLQQSTFKRQLRLTVVFLIMFMEFSMIYIPQTLNFSDMVELGGDASLGIMFTLLLVTSVVNPVLTLCFRKQFRIFQSRTQPNRNRNNVELQVKVAN